eukprot:snap_masked-scaffold_14-processed-gene-3.27-mRNA-1 protein AED:1.00 eAED:1.00 QI:0/-1/0/0/-1/1/1/0/297
MNLNNNHKDGIKIISFGDSYDLQSYFRFSGIEYSLVHPPYPIPRRVIFLSTMESIEGDGIFDFLSTRVHDLGHKEEEVSPLILSSIKQLNEYLQQEKYDSEHFKSITSVLLKKKLPSNIFFPSIFRSLTASTIRKLELFQNKNILSRHEAEELYISLNSILEQKTFLFGEKPSIYDAQLFGHLSEVLIHPPLNILTDKKCQNLVAFYNRITDKYFSGKKLTINFETKYVQTKKARELKRKEKENQFKLRQREIREKKSLDQWYNGSNIFLLFSVLAFGVNMALSNLSFEFEEEEEEE